ncbi:hypothetical protein Mapa_016257 [Marchantia paleacea]|nr:hypothetical protein Mapa_016257 [Marchantia paleacea]
MHVLKGSQLQYRRTSLTMAYHMSIFTGSFHILQTRNHVSFMVPFFFYGKEKFHSWSLLRTTIDRILYQVPIPII